MKACTEALSKGLRKVANSRDGRFEGKVSDAQALCRGGQRALQLSKTPWVDWSNYWGAGDASSIPALTPPVSQAVAQRGVAAALLDLEYQRIELIKFNLFDNSGTYPQFISSPNGPTIKVWPEMRLPATHPDYRAVGGSGTQVCKGDLIRWRTVRNLQ